MNKKQICFIFDTSLSAGYCGVSVTLASIMQDYHWKGVKDVKDYVWVSFIIFRSGALEEKLLICFSYITYTALEKYNLTSHSCITFELEEKFSNHYWYTYSTIFFFRPEEHIFSLIFIRSIKILRQCLPSLSIYKS